MDRLRAKNWYFWLWLSPLLTLPTLGIVAAANPGYEWLCQSYRSCNWAIAERVTILVAVIASSLWHLILAVPAREKEAPFVRWHRRQALLLAGIRTAIPLALGLSFGTTGFFLAVPILIGIWFVGTLWGHRQAARGNCSLMRWAGHGEELSALQCAEREAHKEKPDLDRLLDVIRSSADPQERWKALAELETQGMVEPL